MEQKAKERDHEYLLKKMEYEIKMKEATIVQDNGKIIRTPHYLLPRIIALTVEHLNCKLLRIKGLKMLKIELSS